MNKFRLEDDLNVETRREGAQNDIICHLIRILVVFLRVSKVIVICGRLE